MLSCRMLFSSADRLQANVSDSTIHALPASM